MKNKITLVLTLCAALVGCTSNPNAPINVNPVAALTGQFNPGSWNPALVVEAASQCPQVGSIDASGMGVNFHWARNAPPGYVAQPIEPATPDRIALMRADALASQIYALHNDKASDDVSVSGGGIVVVIHMAYPPSTLNATPASWTNVVVTPPSVVVTTNAVPGSTNTVVSQVIKQ
jgi:hypothetical protein